MAGSIPVELYLADIGDGLCMAIAASDKVLQIDCGSHNGGRRAYQGFVRTRGGLGAPHGLVVSHLHVDHYNGLVYAATDGLQLGISEVYYPRLPDLIGVDREQFLCCLLSINFRILGEETGVPECDLINLVRLISATRFCAKPVSQGDRIAVGDLTLKVLWPPRSIESGHAIGAVRKAIRDFEKACLEDPTTRELFDRIRNAAPLYLDAQEQEFQPSESFGRCLREPFPHREGLPPAVRQANRSLRNAANHFSLAAAAGDALLFMGDIDAGEIAQALQAWGPLQRTFWFLVPPHHGTHWQDSMLMVRCVYSLASNGGRLHRWEKPEYGLISMWSISTYDHGDIQTCPYDSCAVRTKLGCYCP